MERIIEQAVGPITGGAEGAGDAELGLTPGVDADEADNNGAVRFGWKAPIRVHKLPSHRTVNG
jgi:hypothetical protein